VAALVDTNVLVYVYDPRAPAKQRRAQQILLEGLKADSVRLPHQALVEFVAAVTRPTPAGPPLLPVADARREAEELLAVFGALYPNDSVVRTALRGAAMYELPWFDAHMWAYAEVYGLSELWSEDFQHGQRYGTVRVVNPFL
jgi:predicted nucleic acid-binding protein